MKSDWNFDTVKTISALGSIRGTLHELSLNPNVVAEEGGFDDNVLRNTTEPDSSTSTNGSDQTAANDPGVNSDPVLSTVIIKSSRIGQETANDETPSGKNCSANC